MKAWEVFPFSSQMVSQCTCERDFLGHLVIPRFADMKIFLRVRFVNCVFPLYRFISQLNHLYSTLLSFIFYAKSSVLAERNLQIDFFFMCVLVKNGRFVQCRLESLLNLTFHIPLQLSKTDFLAYTSSFS